MHWRQARGGIHTGLTHSCLMLFLVSPWHPPTPWDLLVNSSSEDTGTKRRRSLQYPRDHDEGFPPLQFRLGTSIPTCSRTTRGKDAPALISAVSSPTPLLMLLLGPSKRGQAQPRTTRGLAYSSWSPQRGPMVPSPHEQAAEPDSLSHTSGMGRCGPD